MASVLEDSGGNVVKRRSGLGRSQHQELSRNRGRNNRLNKLHLFPILQSLKVACPSGYGNFLFKDWKLGFI
jgi:hypothetical protein